MTNITDCGAANLLGAIFGEDPNNIKRAMGIPTSDHPCPVCGTFTRGKYCSVECSRRSCKVRVSCSECGTLFDKSVRALIYFSNKKHYLTQKPYQHFFCSAKCRGAYAGKHYGFAVHPENIPAISHFKLHPEDAYHPTKKYDYQDYWLYL